MHNRISKICLTVVGAGSFVSLLANTIRNLDIKGANQSNGLRLRDLATNNRMPRSLGDKTPADPVSTEYPFELSTETPSSRDYDTEPCNATCDQVSSGNMESAMCADEKFPICHYMGNGQSQTLCVNDGAWMSHCSHHDTCGPCDEGSIKFHGPRGHLLVDGSIADWNLTTSFFRDMYNQGEPSKSFKGYALAGKAYTTLNCTTKQLCVLVVAQSGYFLASSLTDSWIKDYNSGLTGDKYPSISPGIVFVKDTKGVVIGWEGCFQVPDFTNSTRTQIEIHADYGTYGSKESTAINTVSTGKASNNALVTLKLCSQNPTVPVQNTTVPVQNSTVPVPVQTLTVPVPNPTIPVQTPTVPVPNPSIPVQTPTFPIQNTTVPVPNPPIPVQTPTVPVQAPTAPVPNPTVPGENTTGPGIGGDGNTLGNNPPASPVRCPPPIPEEATPDINVNTRGGGESGGGYGDPHIKTWTGHTFDFHGECDLVLAHSDMFNQGAGLDLHIRTKIRRDWSFISTAALRIGTDIFQVGTRGIYYMNGHTGARLVSSSILPVTVGGFPIRYTNLDSKRHKFEIDLGSGDGIMGGATVVSFKVYNEFLAVAIYQAHADQFSDAVGLMGHFGSGALLTRDGTDLGGDAGNLNAFGVDWQVRDTEPMLFYTVEGPQYPQKCELPPPPPEEGGVARAGLRRRLLESKVTWEEATAACQDWNEEGRDSCIYDVLQTGDVGMALAMRSEL